MNLEQFKKWIKKAENILGVILGVVAALAWIVYGIVDEKPLYILPGGLAIATIILAMLNGASASPRGEVKPSIWKLVVGGKFEGPFDWLDLIFAIATVIILAVAGFVTPPGS